VNEQNGQFWRRILAEIDDGGYFDVLDGRRAEPSDASVPISVTTETRNSSMREGPRWPVPVAASLNTGATELDLLAYTALVEGSCPPSWGPEARRPLLFSLAFLLALLALYVAMLVVLMG
jgi:hypothetical protein